jgi:MoaA/NifB/PqqE/SkfB family radical SAM enzyme
MAASFPDVILLDTTNICNARCPFCPLFTGNWPMDRTTRAPGFMTQDLFNKIVSEVGGWERRPEIIISANAEILQDPLLKDRLSSLRESKLASTTSLLTNGQLLGEEAAGRILDAGIKELVIGFDGATKEVYEAHRVRCSYDRVLGNIQRFTELRHRRRQETRIVLKFVRTLRNDHEVAAAYRLFSGILDHSLDTFQDCLAVDWSDGMGQTPNYYYIEQATGRRRLSSFNYFETGLQIQSEGTVGACCWDYNLTISNGGLGDVRASTVMEVWEGPARAALRERLARPESTPDKCQKCIILHEPNPPGDELMKIPATNLMARGPTSFAYRFSSE